MAFQRADSIVRTMLSDTILALCRNTLSYEGEVCIEGLLGITVDQKEVFLVHLNETIQKERNFKTTYKRKKRKKNRAETNSETTDCSGSQESDSELQTQSETTRRKHKERSKGQIIDREDSGGVDRLAENGRDDATICSFENTAEENMEEDSNLAPFQTQSSDCEFIKEEIVDSSDAYGLMPSFSILRAEESDPVNNLSLNYGHIQPNMPEDIASSTAASVIGQMLSSSSSAESFNINQPLATDQGFYDRQFSHQRQKRTKGKINLTCQFCGKVWSNTWKYKTHLRTHTGEKPFRCEICGKSFQTKQYAQVHRQIHSGEKRFSCKHCQHSFPTKKCLMTHMQKHSNDNKVQNQIAWDNQTVEYNEKNDYPSDADLIKSSLTPSNDTT